MSGRVEWTDADNLAARVVKPGTRVGNSTTDNYAVVLGDPDDFAFVAQGDLEQLRRMAARVQSLVRECKRGAELGDADTGAEL